MTSFSNNWRALNPAKRRTGLPRRPSAISQADKLRQDQGAGGLTAASFGMGLIIPGFYIIGLLASSVSGVVIAAVKFSLFAAPGLYVLAKTFEVRATGRRSLIEVTLAAYFLLFTVSSIVGIANDPDMHWPTMFGGLLTEAITCIAVLRLGRNSASQHCLAFMRGLQIGFFTLMIVMFAKGSFLANLLRDTSFLTFDGLDRNGMMVLSLLVLCASLTGLTIRRADPRDVVGAALSLFLIFFSASKGAWAGAALLAIAFFALCIMRGWWGRVAAAAAVTVLSLPIIISRVGAYLLVYLHKRESASLSGRTDLWSFGIGRVRERHAYLIGFGYNSPAGAAPRAQYIFHLHNEFVNSYYSAGVLGLLVVVTLLLAYIFKATARVMAERRQVGPTNPWRPETIFCVMIGLMVVSRLMTDVSISSSVDVLTAFLFCCGMLAGPGRLTATSARPTTGWRKAQFAPRLASLGAQPWRRAGSVRPAARVGRR